MNLPGLAIGPWLCAAAATAVALGAAAGCRGGDPPPAGAAARRYTVAAEVVALPRPGQPAQLTVRHEAIPDFVDREGRTVGMPSMVMALDLGPAASAEGLVPGDRVEVVLAVDWTRPLVQIERVWRLPADAARRLQAAPADGG